MRRRTFLAGGAGAAAAITAQSVVGCSTATDERAAQAGDSPDEVARIRAKYLPDFEADYVDHVIVPFVQNSVFEGQRPVLPMIDVALTKENALPSDLWGLLSESWEPAPEEGRHRLSAGVGEARTRQPPQADLHVGGDT